MPINLCGTTATTPGCTHWRTCERCVNAWSAEPKNYARNRVNAAQVLQFAICTLQFAFCNFLTGDCGCLPPQPASKRSPCPASSTSLPSQLGRAALENR